MTAGSLEDIAASVGAGTGGALSVAQARAVIERLAVPIDSRERVSLREAVGRILGADVVSPIDVPAHPNSAMDGYALRTSDLRADADSELAVVGASLAGARFGGRVDAGECVRITTGAVVPDGLDAVIAQELVAASGARISFARGSVGAGDNVRRAGEDLQRGAVAVHAGRWLRPADVGLLASIGLAEATVFRRLRVAYFSTGNELRAPGEPLGPDEIYDSNRHALGAMLQRLGVESIDLGIVADEPSALAAAFAAGCRIADVVVSSGGVSVGDADHTRRVMGSLGEVVFWQVDMRPGRPLAVGRTSAGGHRTLLFGLPGNPVAMMVAFYAFVRDALLAGGGATASSLLTVRAVAAEPLRKRRGRTEFQRGVVARGADGRCSVRSTGSQGAGILRSMSEANGLIVLAAERGDVAAGEEVDVLPFDGLA